jgi:lysophospholipase L1-like esterase
MKQIFCFGHSVTYGRWDDEGGWTARLRKQLDTESLSEGGEDFQVWNLGIPGDDSSDILDRFEDEIERRVWEEADKVILFQVGANDVQYLDEKEEVRVGEEDFRKNVRKMIDISRNHAEKVVFVGEGFTTLGRIPWASSKIMSDHRLEEYNKILAEVCQQEEVPFVNIRSEYLKSEWIDVLHDGVHPNSEGHRKIWCAVNEKLRSEGLV